MLNDLNALICLWVMEVQRQTLVWAESKRPFEMSHSSRSSTTSFLLWPALQRRFKNLTRRPLAVRKIQRSLQRAQKLCSRQIVLLLCCPKNCAASVSYGKLLVSAWACSSPNMPCSFWMWDWQKHQDSHIFPRRWVHHVFSPNSVGHTEGVLTVRVKGPVFNRGVHRGVQHFSCKFPHKMALLTCPCECSHLLSYVCSYVVSYVCSRMCAPMCSHMCAPMCSHMCARTYALVPPAPSPRPLDFFVFFSGFPLQKKKKKNKKTSKTRYLETLVSPPPSPRPLDFFLFSRCVLFVWFSFAFKY